MQRFKKAVLIMLLPVFLFLPVSNQTLAHETITPGIARIIRSLEDVFIEPATSKLLAWVEKQITAGNHSLMDLELVQMAQCPDSLSFSKDCLLDNYREQYLHETTLEYGIGLLELACLSAVMMLPPTLLLFSRNIKCSPLSFVMSIIGSTPLMFLVSFSIRRFTRLINMTYPGSCSSCNPGLDITARKAIHIRQLFYQLIHVYLSAPAIHQYQYRPEKEPFTVKQGSPTLKGLRFTLFSKLQKPVSEADITLHPGCVFKVFTEDHSTPVLQYAVRYSSTGASIILFNAPYSYLLNIGTEITAAVKLLLELTGADKLEVFPAQLPPSI